MAKAIRIVSLLAVLSLVLLAIPFLSANVARANGPVGLLFEHCNNGAGCTSGGMIHSALCRAQTFTAESNHSVTAVNLSLTRTGSPGQVTIAITPTDANGHPLCDQDMAQAQIDGNSLSGAYEWAQVDFPSSCVLTSGTKYAIVVKAPNADGTNDWVAWRTCTGSLYAGGNSELRWLPSPSCTWLSETNNDCLFEVYGHSLEEVWVAPPPVGNDSNPGTQAQPFATIWKGIDTIPKGGTVHVAAGTYVESIHISQSLTLDGAGAGSTVIDGGGISAYNTVVESMAPDVDVTISGFTIQNGHQDAVGGIFIRIMNTLYLYDCTVKDNVGLGAGGILNLGGLFMFRCTVSGNYGAEGGGIQNRGTLYLCNCTISGNSASERGGGIYNYPFSGQMTSEYSTIANNQATDASARGGGFNNWGQATFESTIVANNTAGAAAYNNGFTEPAQGGVTNSNGYNLDSQNSCGFDQPTDLINTDPLLGPLQDNGGPTFTHALLHGSPAIDASTNAGAPATDQRGTPRPQGTTCDIGAYELTQASVTTATGTGTASFSTLNGYITGLTASTESALTCPPREDLDFPHGLFSFTVNGITPGSTATVVIILPSDVPTDTQYWKCINGQWVDCTSLLGSNNGDSVLTLTITDGGLGDRDGVANGEISDPGGPTVAVAIAPAPAPAPAPPRASPTLRRPLNPSQMSVQYLSVNPQQTIANQPVTIITNVVNTGDEAGNLNVTLKINGQLEQSRMVGVGPQGTQPVKFTITKTEPGTYTVDILGQQGSFTVLGTGGTAGAPVNGVPIALLIMGVLVLATVVVLILTRKPA